MQTREIPVRFITSAVWLGLFILFIVTYFFPEGVFVNLCSSLIRGLIGGVGFVVAMPVLLYLFIIHAFSGKRPVLMRSICLGCFLLISGCLSHLIYDPDCVVGLKELYYGGIDGTTGGFICGAIAMFLRWFCGPVIPYILLIVSHLMLYRFQNILLCSFYFLISIFFSTV